MHHMVLDAWRKRACHQAQLLIQGEKAHSGKWDRLRNFSLRRSLARLGFAIVASSSPARRACSHIVGRPDGPLGRPGSNRWLDSPALHLATFSLASWLNVRLKPFRSLARL